MKIIIGCLSLLCALGCSTTAFAQAQSSDYRHQLPLTLDGASTWYKVDLPFAVYLAAQRADLGDLRIFNAQGQAQAFSIMAGQEKTLTQEHGLSVRSFPLYGSAHQNPGPSYRISAHGPSTTVIELDSTAPPPKGSLRRGWLLDTSATTAPLVQLDLQWSGGEDGFQRFSIEASDDLKLWHHWGTGQIARLSFEGEHITQHQVSLPKQAARYVRLLWLTPESAPQLTHAQVFSRQESHTPAPITWSEPLPGQADANGNYVWTLPKALPLEQLRMTLPQSNTLAPLRIEARQQTQGPWHPLARGLLYRVPGDTEEMRQESIQLPGHLVRQLRMYIDPRGGGIGETAPTIEVGIPAGQLLFLARGGAPYHVALGHPTASTASLPLGTLIPHYTPERLSTLAHARLQVPVLPTPTPATVTSTTDRSPWHRRALWGVLVTGVGALALMAYSLLRRPASHN